MKTKASMVWTCSLIISLFVESCLTQKLNILWGPQSMMYLKGKYGKRFVSEEDKRVWKQSLQSVPSLLRGIQRLQLLYFKKPRGIWSSEMIFFQNP